MDENKKRSDMVAFGKALARAKNEMSMQEKKLCYLYLSQIKFKNEPNSREIWMDKKEIAEALGSSASTDNLSVYLRKLAKNMVHHSDLSFSKQDAQEWSDIPLFTTRRSTRGRLMIKLNEDAMPLLEFLKDGEYVTMFLHDILQFSSDETGRRAFLLYEKLRLECDTRKLNKKILNVPMLKNLWDIPKDGKDSYVRKNGKFDRPNFEKRVLIPVLNELSNCQHVVLNHYSDGSLFSKKKKSNRVIGYEIMYHINLYPHKEESTTQKAGRKRRTSKRKIPYNDFAQRDYNTEYADLEKQLANSPNN